MDIDTLRTIVRRGGIIPTVHARAEMAHDGLIEEEVREAVLRGEVVGEEHDSGGARYVVEGRTWLRQRRLRLFMAVETDEAGRDAAVLVTVHSLRRRRERRAGKR